MFRHITKRLRSHREQLLSMLLIPAFVMSSLPKTACICSDGHSELSCPAISCRALHTELASCGCSCCKATDDAHSKACSHGKTCCSKKGTQHTPDGVTALSDCCCHPYVEVPVPILVTKRAEQSTDISLTLPVAPLPLLLSAVEFRPTFPQDNSSIPPPFDAVIVFLHLTI